MASPKNSKKNGRKDTATKKKKTKRLNKAFYEQELERLQFELVRMQYWVKETGARIIITFDGRDAAGKGGIIKRILEPLDQRGYRLVAMGKPSDVEQTQWYFQRYVEHFPSAGEIVIFDRSWYNRAGVERVMGFCTSQEYWTFLRSVPQFERLIVDDGIMLFKYWLSVSDEEQEKRFQSRAEDPARRWKLSPMDLKARELWVEYSKAKDIMMEYTDITKSPWYQVNGEDKRRARLNCIRHLLSLIPYEDMIPPPIELPPRPEKGNAYERPPIDAHFVVPDKYADM